MEPIAGSANLRPAVPAWSGRRPHISVVIPALNEEEPIGDVVRAIPDDLVDEVVVVDNGSTDRTAERARAAGARVIVEPQRGYGRACRTGVEAVTPDCEVVVFLDGDGSDCPEMMARLVEPIAGGERDFVIGSRLRGRREPGSMTAQQIIAGRFAGWLLRRLYGTPYTDMCPFRAIRRDALARLAMRETTYGWNLEMQMRASHAGLRILELPVDHRLRRGGKSKVSGSLVGSVLAAQRIVVTFARLAIALRASSEGRETAQERSGRIAR
jgi:glycosyltransferase involved in cell wall biosynthesis